MKKINLKKVLLEYVGDNVGKDCDCFACEDNRKIVKKEIQKLILNAIEYGAEWRLNAQQVVWPEKGSQKFYEMVGFEKAIVWYQKYLKTLLKC